MAIGSAVYAVSAPADQNHEHADFFSRREDRGGLKAAFRDL
jgi:hypothetical protein